MTSINPFRYGALALDEAFTDRESEIAELEADVRNGQDVVIFAPRRYGKSSLVWRASQELARKKVLVAQVDLMTAPNPAIVRREARAHDPRRRRLAAAAREGAPAGVRRPQGHAPPSPIDPQTGAPSFSFDVGQRREDIDATIERLLELPGELAADRKRAVLLVLDEFQEVVEIDPACRS